MINLIKLQCPNCSANLEVADNVKQCFCTYCGTKILLDNENERVLRLVDEAAVLRERNEALKLEREAKELEEQMRRQALEEKIQKKNEIKEKRFAVLLFWFIFGFLLILFYSTSHDKPFTTTLLCIQTGLMAVGNILWSFDNETCIKIGKPCFIIGCILILPLAIALFS